MVADILLWYIGVRLSAPVWYFVLLGIMLLLQVCSFGWKMYKLGAE